MRKPKAKWDNRRWQYHVPILFIISVVSLSFPLPISAEPSVFWVSDPVNPDETVLVTGNDLSSVNKIIVTRLKDSEEIDLDSYNESAPAQPMQLNNQSVKFVVPKILKKGVYKFNLIGSHGDVSGYLNAPTIYWTQGDQGTFSTAGGWVRIFGRNIGRSTKVRLALIGRETERVALIPKYFDLWNASFTVPPEIRPGTYLISLWNGEGDRDVWRAAGSLTILAAATWPSTTLSVREFGAQGDGRKDDTQAINAGLAALGARGGGTLVLPRGRYLLSNEILIPPHVRLRGEARELVSLNWSEFKEPPISLIDGFSDFSVEDLTIYASNYAAVISGGFPRSDSAVEGVRPRNISVSNVLIRASGYLGHITPEQTVERFKQGRRDHSLNGPVAVRLTGENLSIVNCDIYGSGSTFFLFRPRGAYLAHNKFYNGRLGWYSVTGADGVIFEHNEFTGADLQSTGGGINTLSPKVTSSQNVYFGQNTFSLMHGWDREAITSDGPGGNYYGHVRASVSDKLTLTDKIIVTPAIESWVGAGVFVVGGLGAGEFSTVRALEGNTVTLDQALPVTPDETSIVTIVPIQRNYIFSNNSFSDSGVAIQFYGTSVNHVIVGNSSTRTGGFLTYGRYYPHFQPSWYVQIISNRIIEGNIYRAGTNNATPNGNSIVGAYGVQSKQLGPPLARGVVIRGNVLDNNSEVDVKGGDFAYGPGIIDVVVDSNLISHSDAGIVVDNGAQNILFRNNTLRDIGSGNIRGRSSESP